MILRGFPKDSVVILHGNFPQRAGEDVWLFWAGINGACKQVRCSKVESLKPNHSPRVEPLESSRVTRVGLSRITRDKSSRITRDESSRGTQFR